MRRFSSVLVIATLAATLAGCQLVGALLDEASPATLPPVEAADAPPPPEDLRVGRSLGSPEAPVRIDVYEDPQCPACGLFTSRIEPLLIAGPISDGEVFLTYKDMTFLGPESFEAAAAMRVAEELDGKFWEYHDVLFHNQGTENEGAFSTSRLADMAELIGLERDEFLSELEDPRYVEAVQAEYDGARELGISSVPTLVINGQLHPGVPDWDELRELIDMLAQDNLAATLRGQGDHAGARDLFEQVLEGRTRTLGPEHPDTLITMNDLAMTLAALDEARPAAID